MIKERWKKGVNDEDDDENESINAKQETHESV